MELIGKKFGKLDVLEFSHKGAGGKAYFKCRCDCGNPELKIIRGTHLTDGGTVSCRICQQFELIGKTFGKLTIDKFAYRDSRGDTYFYGRCTCGNKEVTICGNRFINSRAISCGRCMEFELIGKTFGKLTVNKFVYRKLSQAYFECKCACGNTRLNIVGSNLIRKNTTQCLSCARKQKTSGSANLVLDLLGINIGIPIIRREERIHYALPYTSDGTLEYKGQIFQIEIDGSYWHRNNQQRDALKERIVLKNGHIPLRVECNSIQEAPKIAEELYKQLMHKCI